MGHINKVRIWQVEVISPDAVTPGDTITSMRYNQTIQKFIIALEGHIKATADSRANMGFHLRVGLSDWLIDIPLYPEWNKASGCYDLKRSKSTQIANYFLSLGLQLSGSKVVILIIFIRSF
jgi:hypothetical protein